MTPGYSEAKIISMQALLMQVEAGTMSIRRAERRFDPALLESAEHTCKFIRRNEEGFFGLTAAGRKALRNRH